MIFAAEGFDWTTLLATLGGTLAAVMTALGAGAKYLLDHLSRQREEQRQHERDMATRVEGIAQRFEATTREITSEMRRESRETTNTLLEIQKESVDAIGKLSDSVNSLEHAVTELRGEVANKADRPDRPPPRGGKGGGGQT